MQFKKQFVYGTFPLSIESVGCLRKSVGWLLDLMILTGPTQSSVEILLFSNI